jgi:carboxyl-terminal processing protease
VTRALALILTSACVFTAALSAQAAAALETFDAVWTIVRDSHFDPAMNGVNWQAVRDELRPRAAAVRTDGELRGVIQDMLDRLGQSHFALIPSSANSPNDSGDTSGDPGFDVRVIGPEVLVTAVEPLGGAAAAGVRPGWKLTAIAAQPVSGLLAKLPEGLPQRLLKVEGWRMIESRLRGPQGSMAVLTFEDGSGQSKALQVNRRREQGQPATVGHLPTMYVA